MSEWWTYSLSDFLMFSPRTWYRLLELHNMAWLPLQAVTTLAAGWLLWAMRDATPRRLRMALVGTGLAWCFVAWAFHWLRYAPVNWAASYFAASFGLQGLLLVWQGLAVRDPARRDGMARRLGLLMVLAAMVYPLLAFASGRAPAQWEWAGLMPDPTVLATLGILLCTGPGDASHLHRIRRGWLMLIPLAWCAVTGATLWTLNAREWFLMPLAGALALAMALQRPPARSSTA